MEAAPLIKAHDHARAASEATHAANSTVAINEHTRAAGEFANAARSTTSVEALRTLKLLEQHHQRLSELLRIPLERAHSHQPAEDEPQKPAEKADEGTSSETPTAPSSRVEPDNDTSTEKNPQPIPSLPKPQKYPVRDLGASIASNLASARGIRSKYRSQPLTPSVSNAEAPGNLELTTRRSGSGSKSKMQSMIDNADRPGASSPGKVSRQGSFEGRGMENERGPPRTRDHLAPPADEGFSKFYSTFGSIINRISAPLAFAGLPLIGEDPAEESTPVPETPPPKRNRHRSSSSVSMEPDLSKLYSGSTLRAIARDGQSATDSFYVVPTSGHTASYASILSYADKEKRRMEASVLGELGKVAEDPDEDDFVDARESQAPSSPGLRRKTGKSRSEREMNNVVEELYLENKSLKDMLDKLSKRLHAFESMSQTSGMRLAESMRLMRPSSPVSTTTGSKPGTMASGDDTLKKRNQELEEQLLLLANQMEDLQKDYNKARANLIRYREKWDQLKAGAKARRAGGTQGSSEGAEEASRAPSMA
ncbi:uncharacterized protein JN550_001150 [Neoarthrinium moseri]|uniref:uncharacterized protein n=1 Tax=Neoarthrinium moseri TaxID=1658444 RepID=UPI001FDE505C|nr:uncharacterized protein JN550_001150 [Neoarthrinium moseri]KAI1877078.1 hypothetical protein JN550_001150 [Neoarthrinium moseri]